MLQYNHKSVFVDKFKSKCYHYVKLVYRSLDEQANKDKSGKFWNIRDLG